MAMVLPLESPGLSLFGLETLPFSFKCHSLHKDFFIFKIVFKCLFIFERERERERQHEWERGREREEDTESEAGSRL